MSIPEVATGIAAVRPNPFRGRVEIVLGVARREGLEGRVTIYDVAGRRVRSLHSGMISAGHTTIGWDGRDEHGVAAVAGVYFVRVRLGGQEYLRKFVKVH
jgi:flagellar hook assembly protein FlgD